MALTIKFGNVAKRRNSTYVPTAAEMSNEVSVSLKDGCSDTAPVFIINAASFDYNYAQWGTRYYWVTDIEYTRNNLFTVSCELDVLATYKSYITGSTQFVLYDESSNTEIVDNRLSVKTTQTTQVNSANFAQIGGGLSAVVSVVGKTSTTSYIMDVNEARYLAENIMHWLDITALPDITTGTTDVAEAVEEMAQMTNEAFKQLIATGSAKDCIRSAFVIPINHSGLVFASRTMYLGQYEVVDSHGSAQVFKQIPNSSARVITDSVTVNIPWQTTDWRRNAPYHTIYLYIPYIGLQQIPTSDIIGEASLNIDAALDVASGDCIIKVSTPTKIVTQYTASLGVALPIGSSNITPMQMANTILGGVGDAANTIGKLTFGNIGGAIGSAASGIQGIMNNLQPIPSCVGGNGGGAILGISNTVYCISVFHDTNISPDSVTATIGTPTMAQKSLTGLNGFIQCANAHVAAPAEGEVLDNIDAFLNGGFYIE